MGDGQTWHEQPRKITTDHTKHEGGSLSQYNSVWKVERNWRRQWSTEEKQGTGSNKAPFKRHITTLPKPLSFAFRWSQHLPLRKSLEACFDLFCPLFTSFIERLQSLQQSQFRMSSLIPPFGKSPRPYCQEKKPRSTLLRNCWPEKNPRPLIFPETCSHNILENKLLRDSKSDAILPTPLSFKTFRSFISSTPEAFKVISRKRPTDDLQTCYEHPPETYSRHLWEHVERTLTLH